MGISLREAMNIFPFSTAILRAGNQGLDAEVESVNIQEVPEVIRWLKGGEILFTSGYAFHSEEGGVRLIEQLSAKKVAAIAIKPGQYLQAVPEKMIERAEKLGFPLFELPEELPYMDCMVPILERLTQKRLYTLERIEMTRNSLIYSIIKGQGLEGICKVLETISECSIMIMTEHGIILSHSLHEGHGSADEERFRHFCHITFGDAQRSPYPLNACSRISVGEQQAVVYPLGVGEELLAVLFALPAEIPIDTAGIMLLDNVGSMVIIELMKEREVLAHEQKVSGQFLESLLSSAGYLSESNTKRWASYIGFDITRSYCVMVLGMDTHQRFRDNAHIPEASIQRLKSESLQRLKYHFRRYGDQILYMESSMSIVALATVSDEHHWETCRQYLANAVQALCGEYGEGNFAAGIGRVKDSIAEATASYSEARKALRAAVKTGLDVCDFASLGPFVFLHEVTGSKEAEDFCNEYLSPIQEYDRQYNASLVETLSAYFASSQNARKTAESLGVHKNSVIYRLEKIESLLGKSLKDPETAFNLQLGLKLHYFGK